MDKDNNKLNLLSPKVLDTNDEGINKYFYDLRDAIDNKDAYNIAITGNYGTGKSSIIKTYIEKYSKKNTTSVISIGSFLDTTEKKDDGILEPSEKELVEILEKSIIKQIVYKLGYSDSKLSNIVKPKYKWKKSYFFYSISLIIIFIYTFLLLYGNYFYNKYLYKIFEYSEELYNEYFKIRSYLFFLVCIIVIILLFQLIKNILIIINHKKMSIKIKNDKLDEELEINSKIDSKQEFMFLNYIYEIIYFFMNSKIKTIFFEDIDRFGNDICIKIIEDLRELNIILNNCYGINHKITFIYSMKDSVFYSKEQRAKYFDYIISVLPLSTSINSDILFKVELENTFGNNPISNELVEIASYYIKDIRTMKTVINDFSLFDKILNSKNKEKLFAMVLLKNTDFKMYEDIYNQKSIINTKIKSINDNIESIIRSEFTDEETIKSKLLDDKEKNKIKMRIFNDQEERDLLTDLICHNYIDSSYMNYCTSIINTNLLSGNDSRFLTNLRLEERDYSLQIDHADKIISYMNNNDLREEYVLNVSFIEQLIDNHIKEKLELIIEQFSNLNEIKLDFLLYSRINHNIFYKKIIKELSPNNEAIWNSYIHNNLFELYSSYDYILIDIIMSKNINTNNLEEIESLKSIINMNINIENYNIIQNKTIRDNIKKLNIKFYNIKKFLKQDNSKNQAYNHKVLDYIVKNSLYDINVENIKTIIKNDNIDYRIIRESEYGSEITKYLKDNLDLALHRLYIHPEYTINYKQATEYIINTLKEKSEDIPNIIIKENMDFNNFINKLTNKNIELAYDNNKLTINWKLIDDLILKKNRSISFIEKIIIENINLLFQNIDNEVLNELDSQMINHLIDELYHKGLYNHVEILLNNYDENKLKQTRTIDENTSQKTIELFAKKNILVFSDNIYKVIEKKSSKDIGLIYLKNWYKSMGIKPITKYINLRNIIKLKNDITDDEKILLLNKWVKKESINEKTMNQLFIKLFELNIKYKITYKKELIKNVFERIENIDYSIMNKILEFKRKK